MPIYRVSDPTDSRLDDYRNLADAELALNRGIFIAEGRLVVPRLLQASRFATRSILVTDAALAAMPMLGDTALASPVYVVPQAVMNGITGFNIHRGCLAAGVRPPAASIDEVTAGARRVVVLERVANADNVGGIFRSAAALGGDAVILDNVSTDPLYRKAIRTSMGSTLQVPFARVPALQAALTRLRERGFMVVALTPALDAEPLSRVSARISRGSVALVTGHEGDGLTPETRTLCDVQARIPMNDGVDSLNVATAAAIALYELWRQ